MFSKFRSLISHWSMTPHVFVRSPTMIIPISIFSIVLVIIIFFSNFGNRNPSMCPTIDELQSPYVKNYYSEFKHQGLYYEIAFKDVTQPRICKCITSNKTMISKERLQDDFYIQCNGKIFYSNLSFDLDVESNRRGYMIGHWNDFEPMKNVSFPNYIVDVGLDTKTGEYTWAIEFQCIQGKTTFGRAFIKYYGLNFYAKTYDDPNILKTMEKAARKQGLGPFMDSGSNLFRVNHSGCLQDHPFIF